MQGIVLMMITRQLPGADARDDIVSHIYTPGMARRHRKNEHSVCGLEKRIRVLRESTLRKALVF